LKGSFAQACVGTHVRIRTRSAASDWVAGVVRRSRQ
uniref:LysR family transcriptional regulator n=1 Tax=Rodentolepis nana TaxID=102285 RepID=A0A0R3TKS8_RODNA